MLRIKGEKGTVKECTPPKNYNRLLLCYF